MAAYVMAFIRRVHDRKRLEAYWAKAGATFAGTGARPLSVYAPFQLAEGNGPVESALMVEFPDAEAARAWYFGEAYQAVKALRDGAADIDLVIAEGGVVAPPERMPHIR